MPKVLRLIFNNNFKKKKNLKKVGVVSLHTYDGCRQSFKVSMEDTRVRVVVGPGAVGT